MAAKRYFYSATITDFLSKSVDEIVGALTQADTHDINKETSNSWVEEINTLKQTLSDYADRGSLYFEYNIPRMGRRADVIALIDDIVLILEYKTAEQRFTRDALTQVWDYALDLKNFQEGSLDRIMVPILVAPKEKDRHCKFELKHFEDNVYEPLLTNANRLKECIDHILQAIPHESSFSVEKDNIWAKSGYEPTPTIIEAAVALYEENTVEDITKHGGDIDKASEELRNIIDYCRDNNRKAICFITGVPGAGKTLIGLNTAIDQFNRGEKAVYLSGNFPLVEVLQEALTRDYVRREKIKAKIEGRKACTKEEAKSKVKAFIQMIHHYRDLYLEGTEVVDGKIVPIEGYFQSHTDKAYIPAEHVAIFDEAQRSWTHERLAAYLKRGGTYGNKLKVPNFPLSEAAFLIWSLDQREDWATIVCLVGGGQEINTGEAGISEWIKALNNKFRHWKIYISPKLSDKEYAEGKVNELLKDNKNVTYADNLHLGVSLRSYRAEKLSAFVHSLLTFDGKASSLYKEIKDKYPIVLTRDMDKAKKWLHDKVRGTERTGVLVSKESARFKPLGIHILQTGDENAVHWFLEDKNDTRSSNYLEDAATEIQVQGLELDYTCILWDADFRYENGNWHYYRFNGKTAWTEKTGKNENEIEQMKYMLNAYRVLLTRARAGMIICVPSGNANKTSTGFWEDSTRLPEFYNGTYEYLKSIGIEEI